MSGFPLFPRRSLIQPLLTAVILLLILGAGVPVLAGSYGKQTFTFADGTTSLADGSVIASSAAAGVTAVTAGALRMTEAGVGDTTSSFKLPDLDSGKIISAFDASFTARMTKNGTSAPADGWAFNFGPLPSDNGNGESGFVMTNGLAIGWDTYDNGSDPNSIEVFANGASIANSLQTFTFDTTFRTVVIHWDNVNGLTLTYNGVAIYSNLPTPGFVPATGNRFGLTGRTGGSTEDMYLDDLTVTTTQVTPLTTGGPIISEFVANADDSYKDEDNDKSPWIEIYNGQNATVNLAGYHLTDDAATPGKWTFPSVSMGPYGYFIVFASSKDRVNPASQLHTNFSLKKSGGYVALIKPDNSIANSFTYGVQATDIAYGVMGSSLTVGYLDPPTPLASNQATQSPGGPSEAVVFSGAGANGGLITAATSLAIAAPVATGSVVRYTTSQVVPYSGSTAYSGPIAITGNLTVRARVFTPGHLPGPTSSRTFILLDASLTKYAGTGAPFQSNLPIMVLDSFGVPVDSYTSSSNRPYRDTFGVTIMPNATTGLAKITDAPDYTGRSGTHVRGESSAGFTQKQYALKTWDETQDGLDTSLLGMPAGSNWILYAPAVEKSLMRDFMVFEVMRNFRPNDYSAVKGQFCEVFFNQTAGTNISYSGTYHGIYLLKEKIKIDSNKLDLTKLNLLTTTSPSTSGGYIIREDKPDTDSTSLNSTSYIAGLQSYDPDTLNSQQTAYLNSYIASFESALPPTSGGVGPYNYTNYIDTDSFIDSQWFVEWTKQIDGYIYSTYFYKDRNAVMHAGPIWDFNISLGNANYGEGQADSVGELPTGWDYDNVTTHANSYGVGQDWYPRLHKDVGYHVRHWDRYWILRRGALSDAAVATLISDTTNVLTGNNPNVLIPNSSSLQNPAARHYAKYPRLGIYDWPNPSGYASRIYFNYPAPTDPGYSQVDPTNAHVNDWYTLSEVGYLRHWLQQRLAWLDDQDYAQGSTKIYRPPVFSSTGGHVSGGTSLAITPYTGTPPAGFTYPSTAIYYTTNGTDPRSSTGSVAGTLYTGPITLNTSAQYLARMYDNGTWSPLTSGTFLVDAAPAAAGNLVISKIMYNPLAPTTAEQTAGFTSSKQFEYLELMNVSAGPVDLTGVSLADAVTYTFSGSTLLPLAAGGRVVIAGDMGGFPARYGSLPSGTLFGPFSGNLSNDGEKITLKDAGGNTIQQFTWGILDPWPLDASDQGYALVLNRPYSTDSPANGSSWRASANVNGSPGAADTVAFTGLAAGDTDHDGVPDFLEYAMGSNYGSTTSTPTYTASITPYTVGGVTKDYAQFTYLRNLAAESVTYTVELSTDLTAWSSAPADVTYVTARSNGNGTATVTVRSTQAMDALPQAYFRLRVGK